MRTISNQLCNQYPFYIRRGFVVESKRGGGGYIRIIKVKLHDDIDIIDQMLHMIDHSVAQGNAESMIIRLLEEGIITVVKQN